MTNIHIVEIIFNMIKQMGFRPYSIDYDDDYSIVYFRLKGVWEHWQFGMRVNSECLNEKNDERYVAQLFAQYDTQIDKFKPERSALCVNFNASEWHGYDEGYHWTELKHMFKMIRRHPFMCYVGCCGNRTIGYFGHSLIAKFIINESKIKIENLNKFVKGLFWLPYTKLKILLAQKHKCVESIQLFNFEKETGCITQYKYEIRVIFKAGTTHEEICKWREFWFHRNKYGKYNDFDCIIELPNNLSLGEKYSLKLYNKKIRRKKC